MFKQLKKVLRKDNTKEGNLVCKEINIKINEIYCNDKMENIKKKIPKSFKVSCSSILNFFSTDYEFNINEIHNDKKIELICFLIIPRIICRNNQLELIMLTPIENIPNNPYLIMFKNIDTMKILDKIDVKSISSCFLLKNNSFQIEFIHSITYRKKSLLFIRKIILNVCCL